MQLHIESFPGVNISPSRDLNGHKLSRRVQRGLSPTFRALLAYQLESGGVCVHHLTRKQALALARASSGYVSTVARLSPQERDQLGKGILSLSALHNRPPTDADVDRIVTKLGPTRVMAALDRLTRPAEAAE